MRRYQDFITKSSTGLPVSGASVYVYQPGTTTQVQLYTDDGSTTTAQPRSTDSNGFFHFYVADGLYDIYVTHSSITPYTLEDVEIIDRYTSAATDAQWKIADLDVSTEFQLPIAAPGTPAAGDLWEASGVLKHGASSKSVADLATEQTFTQAQTVTAPATAGKVALTLKGDATAAADVLDIYDSAATPAKQSWFSSTGLLGTNLNLTFKSGTSFTGTLDHAATADRTWVFPDAAGTVALTTAPGTSGTDIAWSAAGQLLVPDASGSARGVITTGAQTIAGAKAFTGNITASGTITQTSTSASALTVGRQGATDPALKINANTASSATGVEIIAAAAAGGVNVRAISSGADENLTINAKGAGTISLNPTGTGAITLARATGVTGALTGTSTSASALAVGRQGATDPVLKIDASTASVVTGLSITGAAAAAGVAVAAISSGAAENLTVDAKGTGTITLASSSTGNVVVPRTFVQGTDATDRVALKGIYMSPANVAVTVPAITDPDIAKVDVSVAAAFSMAPAVGDAVIAIPQEAMEANARILGCYVTATDQITLVFGSEGGNVTGGSKNFKFLVLDVT